MKTLQSRIKDVYELSDNAPSLSMTELEYLEAYHHWHHKFDIPEMVSVIRELEAKLAQAVQALEHYARLPYGGDAEAVMALEAISDEGVV